jgi:hypothetical protein
VVAIVERGAVVIDVDRGRTVVDALWVKVLVVATPNLVRAVGELASLGSMYCCCRYSRCHC